MSPSVDLQATTAFVIRVSHKRLSAPCFDANGANVHFTRPRRRYTSVYRVDPNVSNGLAGNKL